MVNAIAVETSLPENAWKTIADVPTGAGCIVHLQISAKNYDPAKAAIRITFDGASQPQIDLPFDAFFCCRETTTPFTAELFWQSGLGELFGAVSKIRMPFGCGFKIEVKGAAIATNDFYASIRWTTDTPADLDGYRLNAKEAVCNVSQWQNMTLVNQPGGAKLLGLFAEFIGSLPDATYLEGNLYVGDVCFSNGMEDLFGSGWYFIDGEVRRPTCGQVKDGGSHRIAYVFWPKLVDGPCDENLLNVSIVNGDPGKFETGTTLMKITPFTYCRYPWRAIAVPDMALSLGMPL